MKVNEEEYKKYQKSINRRFIIAIIVSAVLYAIGLVILK